MQSQTNSVSWCKFVLLGGLVRGVSQPLNNGTRKGLAIRLYRCFDSVQPTNVHRTQDSLQNRKKCRRRLGRGSQPGFVSKASSSAAAAWGICNIHASLQAVQKGNYNQSPLDTDI